MVWLYFYNVLYPSEVGTFAPKNSTCKLSNWHHCSGKSLQNVDENQTDIYHPETVILQFEENILLKPKVNTFKHIYFCKMYVRSVLKPNMNTLHTVRYD